MIVTPKTRTFTPSNPLGRQGEAFAADLLQRQGYRILAHNVAYACGELDLIARDPDGVIVFIEVKTRSTRAFGAAEAVTPRKIARMRRAAKQWLGRTPLADVRFDVIALIGTEGNFSVEHYKEVGHGPR